MPNMTYYSPPRCGRNRLEIYAARLDVAREDVCPIFAHVPGDLARSIAFHRHDLADAPALNEYDGSADSASATAAFFPALDVLGNERVAGLDVRACDEARGGDSEALCGVRMVAVRDLHMQCVFAEVRGNALKLERLEDGPVEQRQVRRAEFAEVLRKCLVSVVFRLRRV